MNVLRTVAGYPLSDDGNVKRLIDRYGSFIRYCPEAKEWIFFENGHWQIDIMGRMTSFACGIATDISNDVRKIKCQEDRDALNKWAHTSGSYRSIKKMVRLARQSPDLMISLDELKAMVTDYWRIEPKVKAAQRRRELKAAKVRSNDGDAL